MRRIIEYERVSNERIMGSFLRKRLIPLNDLRFLKKLWRRAYDLGRKEQEQIIVKNEKNL